MIVLVPSTVSSLWALLRGKTGIDLIAVLAMGGGALVLGECLAGAVIAVMLTGGTGLEQLALARARRELTALVERVPRMAHRRVGDDVITIDVADGGLPGTSLRVHFGAAWRTRSISSPRSATARRSPARRSSTSSRCMPPASSPITR